MYHIPYKTIIIINYENICFESCCHPNLTNIHLGIYLALNHHKEYLMTRYCIQCHLFYVSKIQQRKKPVPCTVLRKFENANVGVRKQIRIFGYFT
jgi:hypothetical protein